MSVVCCSRELAISEGTLCGTDSPPLLASGIESTTRHWIARTTVRLDRSRPSTSTKRFQSEFVVSAFLAQFLEYSGQLGQVTDLVGGVEV
jgi:hypothetical protein